MAEFSLDRFKYRWRGEWSPSLDYRKDDVITRKGKSYVCLIAHTSAANFRTDLNAIIPGSSPPVPDPKWVVMTSGKAFLGPWETAEDYDLGDIVLYQESYYEIDDLISNQYFGGKNPDYPNKGSNGQQNPLNPQLEKFGANVSIVARTHYVPSDKLNISPYKERM